MYLRQRWLNICDSPLSILSVRLDRILSKNWRKERNILLACFGILLFSLDFQILRNQNKPDDIHRSKKLSQVWLSAISLTSSQCSALSKAVYSILFSHFLRELFAFHLVSHITVYEWLRRSWSLITLLAMSGDWLSVSGLSLSFHDWIFPVTSEEPEPRTLTARHGAGAGEPLDTCRLQILQKEYESDTWWWTMCILFTCLFLLS